MRIIWCDNDMMELRIQASNGRFSGATDVYQVYGYLAKVAKQLQGFPRNPSDRREIEFGSFDPNYVGGGAKLNFHCVDGSGHFYVEVTIVPRHPEGGTLQKVVMAIPVEAAAVDRFVGQMETLEGDRTSTACLPSMYP